MTASHPVDPHGDPLVLNLAGLMAEPPGSIREFTFRDVPIEDPELPIAAPLEGEARVARTNRGLFLTGTFRTTLALQCSRCLRDITQPLELALDEEVLPSIDISSGLPVGLEEDGDPEVTRLNDHHELELRPLLLAAISLEEPIAPLCEPDCPGLCPTCGQRLEPGHGHDDDDIDPRLAPLRALRFDAEDESR
jgi:uncharacterized protein